MRDATMGDRWIVNNGNGCAAFGMMVKTLRLKKFKAQNENADIPVIETTDWWWQ
jgi:hypothetical protein